MAYQPVSLAFFNAAFNGALAGMIDQRVISSSVQASYDHITKVAGAWAQACDTVLASSPNKSDYLVQGILLLSKGLFDSRIPQEANSELASFYTVQANAAIAASLQGALWQNINLSGVIGSPSAFNPFITTVTPGSSFIAGDVGVDLWVLCDTTGAATTVFLPSTVSQVDGRGVTVKGVGATNVNGIFISPGAGNKIEDPANPGTFLGTGVIMSTTTVGFQGTYKYQTSLSRWVQIGS